MKLEILSTDGNKAGDVELPKQFNEEIRSEIVRRSILVIRSNKRQKYGASPEAGKRASANVSKRRHNYRGCYGSGVSRVPRKVISRRGTQFNWVGAIVPGTVGGRRAHPPKAEKNWELKINKKERLLAIRSAIAATVDKEMVSEIGHRVPDNYPFIIDDKFELLDKTKNVVDALTKIGLKNELERTKQKKVRAGIGKLRGRKYKKKRGPLVVVGDMCKLNKTAKNIPGVEIVNVKDLNAEVLSSGVNPGRLTLFTKSAIEKLTKEKLFM